MPALDGLRGIAVLLVMLCHFKPAPWLPGGFIGVDLFFVLSGFLITGLLLTEWNATGGVSLSRFYLRRGLRLLPALMLFLAVYVYVAMVFRTFWFTGAPSTMTCLWSAGYSLSYVFNWTVALGQPYPRGFVHLWSLSVEEQYYLVWPCLLIVLLRWRWKPAAVVALTLALAVGSALLALRYGEPTYRRFYFGTDTRAHALLVGSVLGQLHVWARLSPQLLHAWAFRFLLTGAVGFLLWMAAAGSYHGSLMYFAPALVSVCGGVVVIACALLPSDASGVLSGRFLTYLGRRSYSLYLWHFALSFWLRSFEGLSYAAVVFVGSVVAAELSYRLVEWPALRYKQRWASPAGSPRLVADRPGAAQAAQAAPPSRPTALTQ